MELIAQYLEYQRAAEGAMEAIKGLEAARDGALSQVTQLKADLQAEKTAKAEVDKEVAELRPKVKELEDVKTKNQGLELALQAVKDEKVVAVEGAKAEAGQTTVAGFKKSEEFIGLLGERYDGGWVAAKRYVYHSHPYFDWERMETAFGEGVHLQPLVDEPYICPEDLIANVLPIAEDGAPPS